MRTTKVIAIAIISACVSIASAAPELTAEHQAVLSHFKNNEKTAKDAIWTSESVFKVGVLDNGTPRDGYASYVCEVLRDHGFGSKRIMVKIVDIAKLVRTGKWVNLGETMCW